ncbi:hypothetical protein SLEP1_g48345 [Rubroshorea leprosula]|uniref:Prolamin-like domain-containing protein n=1 Tax=Rubroshorea leprosula TaxID=152421 RepID=A0AAV5LUG8_9ROSI|nr:hypothetical protein SLEP1_g48345 [Rubroshorea leprosula]
MAVQKHSILAAMVVLLLAITMASSQLAPAPASAIPNVDSLAEPPNLSAARELFMQRGLKYATEECAKSTWRIIFTLTKMDHDSDYPSRKCCRQLFARDEFPWYKPLVELIVSSPEFKGNKDQIRKNTEDINNCSWLHTSGK